MTHFRREEKQNAQKFSLNTFAERGKMSSTSVHTSTVIFIYSTTNKQR